MLITFEGIDGSGKTTQSRRLFEFLKERGVKVHLFREPGGTEAGDKIRELLMSFELDPKTELLLFEASRAELMKVVRPLLERGEVVILDRFTDSTLAYQGYGRGLDLDLIRKLNDLVTGGIKPEVTFLLDLEPSVALKRLKEKTRFDDPKLLERVRDGYREIAKAEPERVFLIDASRSEEEVFSDIVSFLEGKF